MTNFRNRKVENFKKTVKVGKPKKWKRQKIEKYLKVKTEIRKAKKLKASATKER